MNEAELHDLVVRFDPFTDSRHPLENFQDAAVKIANEATVGKFSQQKFDWYLNGEATEKDPTTAEEAKKVVDYWYFVWHGSMLEAMETWIDEFHSTHKQFLITGLTESAHERGFVDDQIQEYISEAEDQDGEEYWRQFPDVEDLMDDFVLYWGSHE